MLRTAHVHHARSRWVPVGLGAVALALVASTAGAAVVSGEDPTALATAMVGAAPLAGASLLVDYDCVADDPDTDGVDPLCPTGVGGSPLGGFPTNGSTFSIITTGSAALADTANDDDGAGHDWATSAPQIGPDVYDYQVVKLDLGAASGNCLAFDFKFLSEEYPEYVESGYNDAFIAQLNTWAVTTTPATQTVNSPGNFAAGAGDAISVDGVGPSAMSRELAAGTTYDGATLPLIARTSVAPGSTNSLYLTIFDQGDGILDSAVFVDNVRYENQPAGKCKSLAVDPFEGTSGVSLSSGTAGSFSSDLSTFTLPLASNLPTGPIATNISGVGSFINWGDTVPRNHARTARKGTTPLGSGTATIPTGGAGNLVLTNTPAGIAAVRAAQAKPISMLAKAKKLKKKAKKLTKKVKKLQKKAGSASAASAKKLKKLKKKAKKLTKTSKKLKSAGRKLASEPLGTVVVAVTNPSNGTSETLRVQLPR